MQAHGEWTQEEHDLFLETAKRFGVGDKWGLFSSYIPQRVGYQCRLLLELCFPSPLSGSDLMPSRVRLSDCCLCSAYYREVMIPQGLILDPKFRMSRNGKAVYVG